MNKLTAPAFRRRAQRGFTLVELAIVLGVVAVITAGAWKLLSSGNQQVKDQNTAQQQAALIESIKNFLADGSSTGGQAVLKAMTANDTASIPLPTVNSGSTCTVSKPVAASGSAMPTITSICTYLPDSFLSTTKNPYGQTYSIRVQKDNTAAGTAPSSYSFMIATSGGATIPDVNGGRISQFIGADGGFLYSRDTICGTASPAACGALGAWKITSILAAGPSGYGYGSASAGHVASRTYVSGGVASNYFWLARVDLPGDTGHVFNTMATDLYLGTTAGGTPNVFYTGAGQTVGAATSSTTYPMIKVTSASGLKADYKSKSSSLIQFSSPCTALVAADADCPSAFNIVTGDLEVSNGLIQAKKIFSSSDLKGKTDIHPLADELKNLAKVNPVSFRFKDSGSESMGVIAQELETVYPQLVTETRGSKYVEYTGLIAPMIAAIKELKAENERLAKQLDEQAAKIRALESKRK